jgi:DNA polymerase III psi subunit
MHTHEAERQFYLAMAGVRLWYAREPLPGAAPSPEFVFPLERALTTPVLPMPAGNPSAPVHAPSSAHLPKAKPLRRADPAAAARIADLQSLMKAGKTEAPQLNRRPDPVEDVPASTRRAPDPTPAPVMDASPPVEIAPVPAALSPTMRHPDPVVPTADPLKVTLALWQGRNVSLVVALSNDASVKLQQALAHNILRSLGEKEPSENVTVHWPVFNNLLVPGNQPQDLVGVLKPILSGLNAQHLIVLGVNADDRVSADHAGGPVPSWLAEALPTLKQPLKAFRFSLAELAAQPQYKRDLWSAIREWVS